MFARLLALFIGVPLIELALLIKIGTLLGPLPTIALVVVTGFLGAWLARQQGFKVYSRIQQELNSGRLPADELLDGLLILIGGIVLLTPGLLTDLVGFALLIPKVRGFGKRFLRRKFSNFIQRPPPPPREDVIDV